MIVTLFHGEKEGHVLITVNNKVTVIDFKVRDTKSYPLFLDDEFCEIKITKRDGHFYYTFDINKEAQTPLNEVRRKRERSDLLNTVKFFGIGLALMCLIGIVLNQCRANNTSDAVFTAEAVARLVKEADGKRYLVYDVGDDEVHAVYPGFRALPTMMPIREGDTFRLRYRPDRPLLYKDDSVRPTKAVLRRYRRELTAAERARFPNKSAAEIECAVSVALELEPRYAAAAKMFFQDKTPAEKKRFNGETYRKLLTSDRYRTALASCLAE